MQSLRGSWVMEVMIDVSEEFLYYINTHVRSIAYICFSSMGKKVLLVSSSPGKLCNSRNLVGDIPMSEKFSYQIEHFPAIDGIQTADIAHKFK